MTKRIAATYALAALMFSGIALAQTQASVWKIDPAHSAAEFSIRHMGLSNVHGRFGGVNGTINIDPADFTKSSVNATVDVTTVDTGVPQRDGHLKSPDFFDTAKFPTMTFASKSIAKSGDGYAVSGDLTMHGITKPVVLEVEPSKEQVGPEGKPHRGYDASTMVHRQDFGLVWNGTLKSGDSVLGDDVKITLEVEAVKQ